MQSTLWPFEDNLLKMSTTSDSLAQSTPIALPPVPGLLMLSSSHRPPSVTLAPLLSQHTRLLATTGHLHLLCYSFKHSSLQTSSWLPSSVHSGLCSNSPSAEMPAVIIRFSIIPLPACSLIAALIFVENILCLCLLACLPSPCQLLKGWHLVQCCILDT